MLTDFGANPTQALEACLTQFTTPTDAHGVALSHLAEIEACFKHPSLDAILKSLALNPSAWSREALETLSRCAPMSLQVTLARLLKAPGQTFAQTLEMDFILAYHFIHHTDFYEGVRARLLDKDKNPKWNPARVEDVADAMTQAYFVNPQEALSLHLT
jgi:enoyl-CoA hydratase/carnithine racemase